MFAAARTALADAGAVVTDVAVDPTGIDEVEWPALLAEFRHEITLTSPLRPALRCTSLAGLMAFNSADDIELSRFGQENLELALDAPDLDDSDVSRTAPPGRTVARDAARRRTRRRRRGRQYDQRYRPGQSTTNAAMASRSRQARPPRSPATPRSPSPPASSKGCRSASASPPARARTAACSASPTRSNRRRTPGAHRADLVQSRNRASIGSSRSARRVSCMWRGVGQHRELGTRDQAPASALRARRW